MLIKNRDKYINIMKQNCYRLMKLVNNLLDIIKYDAGFITPNIQDEDIILIGRTIPELLLFNWAFFILSQTKFDVKKYSKSSLLFLISNCIIRSLHIQFGIHNLLMLMVYIVINTMINKMPTIKCLEVTML